MSLTHNDTQNLLPCNQGSFIVHSVLSLGCTLVPVHVSMYAKIWVPKYLAVQCIHTDACVCRLYHALLLLMFFQISRTCLIM
jgi:hypothetical protein